MQFFRVLYKGWMRFAHALGIVNTYILLTVFFTVGLLPFGIIGKIVRLFSREQSGWVLRDRKRIGMAELKRLF